MSLLDPARGAVVVPSGEPRFGGGVVNNSTPLPDSPYKHLALRDWPFSVVPRSLHCTFIAGRSQLRNDIESLLVSLTRRSPSSIHVLWSWFGAGKTHSLFYLANRAHEVTEGALVPLSTVYTEFPKEGRAYIDLYRRFASDASVDTLEDAFLEVSTSQASDELQRKLTYSDPDLAAALRLLSIGKPHEKLLAIRWLRADTLPPSEFRKVGISDRIRSTERAVEVQAFWIRLLNDAAVTRGQLGQRVIWVIDEFQRLSRSGSHAIQDINAGLHSLFNACPNGLTQILSFSGPPDVKRLPDWFSPELRDRIGATKIMLLPPLNPSEAATFLLDVLRHFRLGSASVNSEYFPFTKESAAYVIERLAQQSELRPRMIMHAFNAVLAIAEPLIEAGTLSHITPAFAKEALAEYTVVSGDDQDD